MVLFMFIINLRLNCTELLPFCYLFIEPFVLHSLGPYAETVMGVYLFKTFLLITIEYSYLEYQCF